MIFGSYDPITFEAIQPLSAVIISNEIFHIFPIFSSESHLSFFPTREQCTALRNIVLMIQNITAVEYVILHHFNGKLPFGIRLTKKTKQQIIFQQYCINFKFGANLFTK